MPSDDLKLFTAIIVAIFLAVPYLKGKSKSSFSKAGKRAAAMLAGRSATAYGDVDAMNKEEK